MKRKMNYGDIPRLNYAVFAAMIIAVAVLGVASLAEAFNGYDTGVSVAFLQPS